MILLPLFQCPSSKQALRKPPESSSSSQDALRPQQRRCPLSSSQLPQPEAGSGAEERGRGPPQAGRGPGRQGGCLFTLRAPRDDGSDATHPLGSAPRPPAQRPPSGAARARHSRALRCTAAAAFAPVPGPSPAAAAPPPAQVQKVTPEELEVAIANRDKAILVDFFGAQRHAARMHAWRSMQRVARSSARMHAAALQRTRMVAFVHAYSEAQQQVAATSQS